MDSAAPLDLSVSDVRPFVPARDFAMSRAFYTALGWTTLWSNDTDLALLQLGESRFMLQDKFVREWAENSMLTIECASAAAWHAHASSLLATGSFGDARFAEPRREDWGATVTYVWDPSGVLLHFTEWDRHALSGALTVG